MLVVFRVNLIIRNSRNFRAYRGIKNKTVFRTMLDINLFRTEKGGNPELIKESQKRRNAPVEIVDDVIALDKEWIKRN